MTFGEFCKAFDKPVKGLKGINSKVNIVRFFLDTAMEKITTFEESYYGKWFHDTYPFNYWGELCDAYKADSFVNALRNKISPSSRRALAQKFEIELEAEEEPDLLILSKAIAEQFYLIAKNNGSYDGNVVNDKYQEFKTPSEWGGYVQRARDNEKMCKSLFYRTQTVNIDSFYVWNRLSLVQPMNLGFEVSDDATDNILFEPNVEQLFQDRNHVLLIGMEGIGKSMMIRKMFLSALDDYGRTGVLPFLICLRDYNSASRNLLTLITESINLYDETFTSDEANALLYQGKAVVYMDGLDEISRDQYGEFHRELDRVIKAYKRSKFLITTRNYTLLSASDFKYIWLLPFTGEQSKMMVEKLNIGNATKNSIEMLIDEHAEEYKEYISVPMLLTLFAMNYDKFDTIPSKRYELYEKFVDELKKVNENIIVLGTYKNAKTPVLCKCKICDHEWPGIPNNLLREEGCMNCTGHLKKTTESFVEEMSKVNPDIEILGEYVNIHTKIAWRCKVCDYTTSSEPASLLQGHGCKPCARKRAAQKRRKTNEQFLKELEEKNPGVIPLEPYVKSDKSIHCRCVCGNEDWHPKPSKLLKGKLCSKCTRKKQSQKQLKPEEVFLRQMEENNPYVEVIGAYAGIDERIECRCKRCGHQWNPIASFVHRGGGCPECKKRLQTSFPEQAIYYYLKEIYPEAINSYKDGFGRSHIDIYLPSLKTGIEYDGRESHKAKEKTDMWKYDICKKKEIKLVRVREIVIPEGITMCDHVIYSEFGNTKQHGSLDEAISKLFNYLNIEADIDTKRDVFKIQEQYFSHLEEESLGKKYPHLVEEWYQPKNGGITPFMVKPKSNVSYYWKCPNPECNEIYPATPASRTGGSGCAKCANVKRLTQEEFEKRVHDKFPKIEVLGEYVNMDTEVKCKCLECDNEWESKTKYVLNGAGCPECYKRADADKKRKPEEIFLKEVKEKHPYIKVIGRYINNKEPVECECTKCGEKWSPIAQSLVSGYGCPGCAPNKPKRVMCVETEEIFESVNKAAKAKNTNRSTISNCCNGKGMTAGGFHWKFVE